MAQQPATPTPPSSNLPSISGGVTQTGNVKVPGNADGKALAQAQAVNAQRATVEAAAAKLTKHPAEMSPAFWDILPNEDDTITARNTVTGKSFTGTPKEFSQMLRA